MSAARDFYDRHINARWPEQLPALTEREAISAARRLFRRFRGRKLSLPIKATTGRRYTGARSGVFYVNPTRGWRALVHELSHEVFARVHPSLKPHDPKHAYLERDMTAYVVESGWLDGTLRGQVKAPKTPAEKDAEELERPRAKALTAKERCERLAETLGLFVIRDAPREYEIRTDGDDDFLEHLASSHRLSGVSWSDLLEALEEIDAMGTAAEYRARQASA